MTIYVEVMPDETQDGLRWLRVSHNGTSWSSVQVRSEDEARQIAEALQPDLAALRQRIAELEGALKEARQVVGFAIGTFDGYQQTASEFAAVTKMQEWQERTRAAQEER